MEQNLHQRWLRFHDGFRDFKPSLPDPKPVVRVRGSGRHMKNFHLLQRLKSCNVYCSGPKNERVDGEKITIELCEDCSAVRLLKETWGTSGNP